jgi:hypothetical protein
VTNRPDFSEYVVHFTKPKAPLGLSTHRTDANLLQIKAQDARKRLENILSQKQIIATPMPWINAKAVCFTECVWDSLLQHCKHYSAYGVGFHKSVLMNQGGGPALYMRRDLKDFQRSHKPNGGGWSPQLEPFITDFNPEYGPEDLKNRWAPKKSVDFSHEREWRVPGDFRFTRADIAFIIVDVPLDVTALNLSRDLEAKTLIMSNYRKVKELWPDAGQAAL